jgi:ribosome-binding protein aMBF1 (putative translation factor)
MLYYASPAPVSTDTLHNAWRRMFGVMVQDVREFMGHSVEEAAQLAGMEPSVWAAVEDGEIIVDPACLRPMADALGIRFDRMVTMVHLCQFVWQQ